MDNIIRTALFCLAALTAASCSNDDIAESLVSGSNADAGGAVSYTFTATLSAPLTGENPSTTSTRATSTTDDAPTRCFMQAVSSTNPDDFILVEGSIESDRSLKFSIDLHPDVAYTYLFWADNATQSVADLRAVPYAVGTVAYAQSVATPCKPAELTSIPVLRHAVAKLTVRTTATMSVVFGRTFDASIQCPSTFNVATNAGSNATAQSLPQVNLTAGYTAGTDLFTTYLIPNADKTPVTFSAFGASKTVDHLPLKADSYVTFTDNFSTDGNFWGTTFTPNTYQKFYSYFFDYKGTPKGYYSSGTWRFENAKPEKILEFVKAITGNNAWTLPDVGQEQLLTEQLLTERLSLRCVMKESMPGGVLEVYLFWFKDESSGNSYQFDLTSDSSSGYPDFSTIWP